MRRRARLLGFTGLLLAFAAGCGEPPTKEEAASALADMELEELTDAFSRAFDAAIDAGGLSPAPSGSAGASGARGGAAPRPRPLATVDEMKCQRVDRKTYDCDVAWRSQRGGATKGLYRFLRGDGKSKWTASRLSATAR